MKYVPDFIGTILRVLLPFTAGTIFCAFVKERWHLCEDYA